MTTASQTIRNAVRALIYRNGKILLLRKKSAKGRSRYALPGGAQDPGETLKQALKRECMEEIDTRVSVRELVHVADYFKPPSATRPSPRQAVEFLFVCEVAREYVAHNGPHPDKNQSDVVWMKLKRLSEIDFQPKNLVEHLIRQGVTRRKVYLGDVE